MGFSDVWNRTLVYFGIAEEEDEWDEDGYLTEEDLERTYSERPNVRRLTPRRQSRQDFDDWTDPEPEEDAPRPPTLRQRQRRADGVVRAVPSVQVHLVIPRSFNDAQQIATASRVDAGDPQPAGRRPGALQTPDRLHERPHLRARRRHAAGGQGLLLTPRNVEVSAEERQRMIERASSTRLRQETRACQTRNQARWPRLQVLADAASSANHFIDVFIYVYILRSSPTS
jgi:cell division inhibitor SepF